jgi:hypothetical protein
MADLGQLHYDFSSWKATRGQALASILLELVTRESCNACAGKIAIPEPIVFIHCSAENLRVYDAQK